MKALAWTLGIAAIGTQIGYPLTSGPARDGVSIAVVILLAAACVAHAAAVRGIGWSAGLLVITVGGGMGVEVLGIATGVPFGSYAYAEGRLGPELAGVPLLIGLAWTAGAYPAWCAAERVATQHRALQVVLAAVGLAAWDLYLDPQMVADGRWRWIPGFTGLPGVPQVPVSNYLGWLLTAGVLASLLHLLPATPREHSDALPITLYLWTWLGSGLAHAVFLDLPVSAAYGFVAMGLLGAPLLWTFRRATRPITRSDRAHLARWARASFGRGTHSNPPDGSVGRRTPPRDAAARRLPPRADDHGNFRC